MSKKGSKNDIKNRGAAAKLKTFNGKVVKPVKYISVRSGSYIAGRMEGGDFVRGQDGVPVPYSKIISSDAIN